MVIRCSPISTPFIRTDTILFVQKKQSHSWCGHALQNVNHIADPALSFFAVRMKAIRPFLATSGFCAFELSPSLLVIKARLLQVYLEQLRIVFVMSKWSTYQNRHHSDAPYWQNSSAQHSTRGLIFVPPKYWIAIIKHQTWFLSLCGALITPFQISAIYPTSWQRCSWCVIMHNIPLQGSCCLVTGIREITPVIYTANWWDCQRWKALRVEGRLFRNLDHTLRWNLRAD